MSHSDEDPLCLYDELRLAGQAQDAESFAARYPEHSDLLARIRALDALDSDLHRMVHRTTSPDEISAEVPGYFIEAKLGAGGSGRVYRARNRTTNEVCALKIIPLHSDAAAARFQREVALLGVLQHDGIAKILDSGLHNDFGYISQELVVGQNLEDFLEPGKIPDAGALERRLKLWRQVIAAVAFAHEQNITHRDIKPSNVLVTGSGQIKIIDFGLALPLHHERPRVTRTGVFVGSFNYAAPEQLAGRRHEVGPPTDVFALGLVGYELCTGRPAYSYSSLGMRLAHCQAPIPVLPRKQNPLVARSFQRLLLRATHLEPKKRFANAGKMLTAAMACL